MNSRLDRLGPKAQELSKVKISGLLRRQRKLISLLLALIGIPLFVIVFNLKDRFAARTLIALDQTSEQLVGTAIGKLPSVDTEVEIMMSSSILHEVAMQLTDGKGKGSAIKTTKMPAINDTGDGAKEIVKAAAGDKKEGAIDALGKNQLSPAALAVRWLHKHYIARLHAIKQKQQIVSRHARVVSMAMVPRDTTTSGQWGKKVLDWVIDRPNSDYNQAIQQLWFAISQKQQSVSGDAGHGSIMITSRSTSMGKECEHDVIAPSVARIASLSGQKVVIVDGGHRSDSLCKLQGLQSGKGLSDLDRNPKANELLKTMQKDTKTALRILTAGAGEQSMAGGFAYPMVLGNIVARLEREFDLVIIVAPGRSQRDKGSLYAVQAGMTLVVVEAEAFKAAEISEALQRLYSIRDTNVVTAMTRKT